MDTWLTCQRFRRGCRRFHFQGLATVDRWAVERRTRVYRLDRDSFTADGTHPSVKNVAHEYSARRAPWVLAEQLHRGRLRRPGLAPTAAGRQSRVLYTRANPNTWCVTLPTMMTSRRHKNAGHIDFLLSQHQRQRARGLWVIHIFTRESRTIATELSTGRVVGVVSVRSDGDRSGPISVGQRRGPLPRYPSSKRDRCYGAY